MSSSALPLRSLAALLGIAAVLVAAAVFVWQWRRTALPAPGTPAYEQVSTTFYRGLAALQVGLLENAVNDFTEATMLVPPEPAVWANLGVARMRLGDLEAAAEPVGRALSLAPDNADMTLLAARMEIARGRLDDGVAHLRRAVDLDPRGLRARFALAEELERGGSPEADEEALRILDELQTLVPANLAVLLERARVAAKRADADRLDDAVRRIGASAAAWPPIAVEQYDGLRQAAAARDFTQAARRTALLRNVLARVPAYSADLASVRTAAEVVAEPFERFLLLTQPVSTPAAADRSLSFSMETLDAREATAVVAVSLDGDTASALFAVDASAISRLDGPRGTWPFPAGGSPPGPNGLLALDWNNDFKTDLLAAGAGGVRLFLQNASGSFEDHTAAAGTSVSCECAGAWAADVEMDGDLDVVLGVNGAATILLRNNGDGTWMSQQTFAGVTDVRGFSWADLDADADPDALFLDGRGTVRMLRNRQAGQFAEVPPPASWRDVAGATVADLNADGVFDIVVATSAGSIRRAFLGTDGQWNEEELVGAPAGGAGAGTRPAALYAVDLDNNGALDLVRSNTDTRIWLADERHRLTELPDPIAAAVTSIADIDNNGRLDLVGIAGGVVRLQSRGDRPYHWKQARMRAQPTAGDQRVNSFGAGGEIEVRAGLLRQKQLLTGLPAHFGLGNHTSIDVVRIVWPNGIPQAEFGERVDDAIVVEQRLKGSCPWVFAHDGEDVRFVTDFLWRSPLGLRINAQDTAGVSQTEDWVRIRGDQLAPRNGVYDIRISAELWETHFFDHVSLMVVDHPEGTEVFVDERFSTRPVAFAARAFRDLRPVARATDAGGRDVTDLVARRDGRHLATFERGRYQGIAREHFVEFDTGERAARAGLTLVAQGWVYPTDSSINVAVGQGRHDPPRGIALEAQDDRGRWTTIDGDLGFPAGKNKTMLIDLSGAPGARRFRLRTNLEVYWDSLATAIPASVDVRTSRLHVERADLRYRGFSKTTSPRGDAPETPTYAPIAASGQRWRDLVGYYTRFGDVRELLAGVDDRYVIMNAGDELRLEFPAAAAAGEGWRRDFVLIGDGWEKDGDSNTEFSQTVLPLPSHGPAPYGPAPSLELEDDPVYQRHRSDWERYHTRYVTPRAFVGGLSLGR
jgi:tetratricopeptide (TPR) repeat protein